MIYLLSTNFRKSCTGLCDSHLNESIMDTGMAISYYLWINKPESVAFDAAHYYNHVSGHLNHETCIPRALFPLRGRSDFYNWVVQSSSNYAYLIQYLIELVDEYLYRFSSPHKFTPMIRHLPKTEFISVNGKEQLEKRIKACQQLYIDPQSYWKWTNRDRP